MLNEDLEDIPGVSSSTVSILKSVVVTPPKKISEKTAIGFNTDLSLLIYEEVILNPLKYIY